jgi:hypothetical protein
MSFGMNLWQVQGTNLQEIALNVLDDEQRLEEWVVPLPRSLEFVFIA